jgi:hypothetical protein
MTGEGTWSRGLGVYAVCGAYGGVCDGGELGRAVDVGGDGVYGRLRIRDNEVVVCANIERARARQDTSLRVWHSLYARASQKPQTSGLSSYDN